MLLLLMLKYCLPSLSLHQMMHLRCPIEDKERTKRERKRGKDKEEEAKFSSSSSLGDEIQSLAR